MTMNNKRQKNLFCEQADGTSKRGRGYHQFLKRWNRRAQRRQAKLDHDYVPSYNRFKGWET